MWTLHVHEYRSFSTNSRKLEDTRSLEPKVEFVLLFVWEPLKAFLGISNNYKYIL